MLDFMFNRSAAPPIPPTHLDEDDVLLTLRCEVPYGETMTDGVGDPGSGEPYARYTFSNFSDGKTFELAITSRQEDGKIYNSHVKAERIAPGVLDIKSVVFDNQPEDLRNAKEIYSVLTALGEQVRDIILLNPPAIHENKREFGAPCCRFITRHMRRH